MIEQRIENRFGFVRFLLLWMAMSTVGAMLQVAAPSKPPGGKRVSRAEVERRAKMVEEMLSAGRTRHEMAESMGMPLRTIDVYAQRVRTRWLAQAKSHSQDARSRALDRLFELRARLVEAGSWSNVVSLERLITTLEGAHESSPGNGEQPLNRAPVEAPVITAKWISERAALLVRALVGLASKSEDDALRAQISEALTQGIQMLGDLPASPASGGE